MEIFFIFRNLKYFKKVNFLIFYCIYYKFYRKDIK